MARSGKNDNRFIDLHECLVTGELPPEIKSLIGRCEINERSFTNDDLSLALKFGEMVWRRLLRTTVRDEILDTLTLILTRAKHNRSKIRKRVDAGISDEIHLAHADGLVSGLEDAIAVVEDDFEEWIRER